MIAKYNVGLYGRVLMMTLLGLGSFGLSKATYAQSQNDKPTEEENHGSHVKEADSDSHAEGVDNDSHAEEADRSSHAEEADSGSHTQEADIGKDMPIPNTQRIPSSSFANMKLSGADLDYEVVGDQLILKGQPRDLDLLEALITVLEDSTERKELRVVTVTEKDANDIARSLQESLPVMLSTPNQRLEYQVQITAVSANILMVSALPDQIDFVVDLIERVDKIKTELPDLDQLVFQIRYLKASAVALQLTDILTKIREKQGASGIKNEIQVIANDSNNTVLVLATEEQRKKIKRLIDGIDVEPAKGWGESKLTLFPLTHSKAKEMATTINDLLLASAQGDKSATEVISRLVISKAMPDGRVIELSPIDLQKRMRIVSDIGSNSLIVATAEENIEPIGELIRLLDMAPLGEDVGVKLFPLRFADAKTVGETLTQMFADGKTLTADPDGSAKDAVPDGMEGKALVYSIGIATDERTNTLVVSGRAEQIMLAETIIQELDKPAVAYKFPLRLIPLEYTDATRVGEVVTALFDQRFAAAEALNAGSAALERDRVFMNTDIRTNTLIVSASDENFKELVSIVRQLDTKPAKLFDQIRIVQCTRLTATDVKTKIDELWQRKAALRQQDEAFEDLPIVVADERSNTLVVASSIEDFAEIERLVKALDSQPMIENTELFKLAHADALALTKMLDDLFQGMSGLSETFQAPTILADARSNSLLVGASRDGMARVTELVKRLDVEAGPMSALIEVYALKHGSAIVLSQRLQDLFDAATANQDSSSTPVVIMADEASNSIVCSASRDGHKVIIDLLDKLDKPSNLARQFQIFPLQMAKAVTVAERLATLFQGQGDSNGGRTDAIAVEADERINSLIVWAAPSQMENIAQVIEKLDTATPSVEMMVKIVQLKQALAEDFATLLEETLMGQGDNSTEAAVILSFHETLPDGTQVIRKLLRQDIRIQADPRTNSLMVMAPAGSMDMLEAMIVDFDKIKPIRSEVRLFPLRNSDAETMVDRLTEIFNPDSTDGAVVTKPVFGQEIEGFDFASVGQDIRFSADPRTNTLIAAGAEVDLHMVEQLIYYLDQQDANERITQVYPTKFRDPSEIAGAISNFNQQEQDALGELGDQEAARRRRERQISIEAVGTEDQGSSNLIIGTSAQAYQSTMEMVAQLDRPEPQVRISVLIAELTLGDDIDLGIELAGQDLTFSQSAAVGPNGILQGSNFDFVGGTDLGGIVGLGGFNFAITGEDFNFLFHALQQKSRLEVLSRPTVLVRNGEEGKITIADQVPIVESSRLNDTGQTQSTIGREDVGIVLTVTPQISPDGYVTIALVQEISQLGENLQLTEGVQSPTFITREVQTNVTIRDGETVVIGGLIQQRDSTAVNKVPILGDIPYLGVLFRSTTNSHSKTELLVVLSAQVSRTDEDRRRMSGEELNRFSLPRSMTHDPLMESLRILPQDTSFGPVDSDTGDSAPTLRSAPKQDKPSHRDMYGPKPKTYGPRVPRSATTMQDRSVYGPRIAKVVDAEGSLSDRY